MPDVLVVAILTVLGYLIGSIPFGVVISRLLGTTDPRTAGSRNVGFTNVLRVGGKRAGILTLIGDLGKGWIAAWTAGQLLHDETAILAVALSVIVGHLHSLFLGFKGGKGVATALGAVLGLLHGVVSATALVNVLLPAVHPRMGNELTAANSSPLLEPPGFLLRNYGRGTLIATLLAHAAYGAIVGGFASVAG